VATVSSTSLVAAKNPEIQVNLVDRTNDEQESHFNCLQRVEELNESAENLNSQRSPDLVDYPITG